MIINISNNFSIHRQLPLTYSRKSLKSKSHLLKRGGRKPKGFILLITTIRAATEVWNNCCRFSQHISHLFFEIEVSIKSWFFKSGYFKHTNVSRAGYFKFIWKWVFKKVKIFFLILFILNFSLKNINFFYRIFFILNFSLKKY